jgi:hypothetical protein
MSLAFEKRLLEGHLFLFLRRWSDEHPLVGFVIFGSLLRLGTLPYSLDLKLTLFDDVDVRGRITLTVDCLVSLVCFLTEREGQPSKLGPGPMAETRYLQQEINLLLLGFQLKLLKEPLVVVSSKYSKIALAQCVNRCSSWLVIH